MGLPAGAHALQKGTNPYPCPDSVAKLCWPYYLEVQRNAFKEAVSGDHGKPCHQRRRLLL
eukprot:scaffold170506_cov13-Tisochrysis_lutea.AAC.1